MVRFTIQVILCSFPRGGMSGALNLRPLVPIVRECQGICEPKGRALRLAE